MPRPWKHHIDLHDIWQDESIDFEMRREAIVDRIRGSLAWQAFVDDWELESIVDELADTAHEEEFDYVWNELYDWADTHRVWIELWSPVVKPVQDDLQRLLTELKGT